MAESSDRGPDPAAIPMHGMVISNVVGLHDDPEIARPPSPRRFQVRSRSTDLSDHADGVFAHLFRPLLGPLSRLYCRVRGPDFVRIEWSSQGRERLDSAIVGGLKSREPYLFRPGAFPALAALVRNDWFSLLAVEGPEARAVELFDRYESALRAGRRSAGRLGAAGSGSQGETGEESAEAVERAFVGNRAEIAIRGWDGSVWESHIRDAALFRRLRQHLSTETRVRTRRGSFDEIWHSLRAPGASP